MGIHSLGSGVSLTRTIQRNLEAALDLAKKLLDDYRRQGFEVVLRDSDNPHKIKANIRNHRGTDLEARIMVRKLNDSSTELIIELYGDVYVGGLGSLFARESLIVREATKRLNTFLDSVLL